MALGRLRRPEDLGTVLTGCCNRDNFDKLVLNFDYLCVVELPSQPGTSSAPLSRRGASLSMLLSLGPVWFLPLLFFFPVMQLRHEQSGLINSGNVFTLERPAKPMTIAGGYLCSIL